MERNLHRDIELRETAEIGASQCEWMRKDGSTITVRLNCRAIRTPDGAVVQTLVIAEELTKQRSSEGQSRRAQTMDAAGHLASGVAHDFK
ncbi:MAG: multi-sensor hybrid histidine kinase [Bryobacterales bacterium]|nr:multi-sensor hybrid histidine kinase [Bryobacterales bacterium]